MNTELEDFARPQDITAALSMRRVAVVGLSPDPHRPCYSVGHYLQARGYTVVPVNPGEQQVLGERSYPSLTAMPEPPELVDVFRRPDAALTVVEEAIAAGAKGIWFQLGIINIEAARKAREAGLITVMNRCMKIELSLRDE